MNESSHIDIVQLRSWIGRKDETEEILTAAAVARFEATFALAGLPAAGAPRDGAAPHLIHWCLAQPAAATDTLGPDGHPERGEFLPPVPLPRRMWAGGAITFKGAIRIGETMTRGSRISDISIKQGRTGTLCFVTVTHAIACGGRAVLEERQDIVYREAAVPGIAGGRKENVEPAAAGCHRVAVTPSAALLFRYSALTFNAHRIHYDRGYATDIEGYDGLVVHGPLQASLLLRFASLIAGAPPIAFSFRGVSPLCDGADFTLNADEDEGGLKLWTARDGGPIAMTARAEWR